MSVTIYGNGQVPIQVQSTVLSTTFSTTSASYVDITGLSVNITPKSTTSKILVMVVCPINGGVAFAQLVRNSTAIFNGSGGTVNSSLYGYTASYIDAIIQGGTIVFVDSPSSTATLTYKMQIYASGGTAYVGRPVTNPTGVAIPSSITVLEISGS